MKIRNARAILGAIATVLLLASCGSDGGAGGGSGGATTALANNWDTMVWDQGTWQ
jgi:hypothetical protein